MIPSKIVDEVKRLLYDGLNRRYLQDSPILRDVWLKYAVRFEEVDGRRASDAERVELLLAPKRGQSPAQLASALLDRLEAYWKSRLWRESRRPLGNISLMHNESYVVVRLHFDELICAALPLTQWWHKWFLPIVGKSKSALQKLVANEIARAETKVPQGIRSRDEQVLARLGKVVGTLEWWRRRRVRGNVETPSPTERAKMVVDLLKASPAASVGSGVREMTGYARRRGDAPSTPLWSVAENRLAHTAINRSVATTKADAVRNLFKISCAKICWAVLDTGIDAVHEAFRKRQDGRLVDRRPFPGGRNQTRVTATYDFTKLKSLFGAGGALNRAKTKDLRTALNSGRMVAWSELAAQLRVPHNAREYPPVDNMNPHGTHVAGILGADWPHEDNGEPLSGMCPDIELYDFRVLNDEGEGDEFSILAALQFVRYLNSTSDTPVIHGINLSLSLARDSENYACGRTPICEECNRLTSSGVVVVAAAGNEGNLIYNAKHGNSTVEVEGFQLSSITDPGNAESVITVGATHRYQPHTYGVSYFSSRGPTGDGRQKPDLLAPGEKINSTAPGGVSLRLDGTSMAAPHVSGAAALLMAKYPELVGHPARIKQILCNTATDLGRHHWMQGAGALDILRAMQSV